MFATVATHTPRSSRRGAGTSPAGTGDAPGGAWVQAAASISAARASGARRAADGGRMGELGVGGRTGARGGRAPRPHDDVDGPCTLRARGAGAAFAPG